jgi:aconitase B
MAGGDSHTGFDSGAFTVGAVSGVGVFAGALGAGIANARQSSWDRFNRKALTAGIEVTEARHNRIFKQLEGVNRRIDSLQSEVIGLRAELKAVRVQLVLIARGE